MRPQPRERQVAEETVREIERTHVQHGSLCEECSVWVQLDEAVGYELEHGVEWPCAPVLMAREIRRLWAVENMEELRWQMRTGQLVSR